MKSYSVVKAKAKDFALERNMPVYIARARKNGHYRIIFSPDQLTPNHDIVETVYPIKKGGKA